MTEENKVEGVIENKEPKNNWIIIAIVAIVILIIGLAIYYSSKAEKNEEDTSDDTQVTQENDKPVDLGPLVDYTDEKGRFTIKMPAGYLLDEGIDGYFNIVKDDGQSLPEVVIIIEKNGDLEIDESKALQIISERNVRINGLDGKKYTVTYKVYPAGNRCPIYRLTDGKDVYQISEYECLESDIFETVVNSFKLK